MCVNVGVSAVGSTLCHRISNTSGCGDVIRFAYLIYPSEASAKAALQEYEAKDLQLNGVHLTLLSYREPVTQLPRGEQSSVLAL